MAFRTQGPKVPRTPGSRLRTAARPDDPAIETKVRIGCAITQAAEQARPPVAEARSAALPACSDGFDNVDGGPECGVYIQMRGIQQVRIAGAFERGSRARTVALVPAQDVGEHIRSIDAGAGRLQLGQPPGGADLRAGGDEDFHVA